MELGIKVLSKLGAGLGDFADPTTHWVAYFRNENFDGTLYQIQRVILSQARAYNCYPGEKKGAKLEADHLPLPNSNGKLRGIFLILFKVTMRGCTCHWKPRLKFCPLSGPSVYRAVMQAAFAWPGLRS